MKKRVSVLLFVAACFFAAPTSTAQEAVLIDGDVVCKCRSGFLGKKCKADGTDGGQCNASDKCWESNRNC